MKYIDMLSKFGAGSAHPGGFAATLRQLNEHQLPPESRVLEVGCGTGRTACYLAVLGHRVTAVDIHAHMLSKAKRRADAMGVNVALFQADGCALPFSEESFDAILVESATNFMNAKKAVSEYYRVLASGGTLYDRELMIDKPLPEKELTEMKHFFGIPQILQRQEWLETLRKEGFSEADVLNYSFFTDGVKEDQFKHEDPYEFSDDDLMTDMRVWQIMTLHDQMIFENTEYLTFGLIKAVK